MGTKAREFSPTLTKFDPIEIDYGRSVKELAEAGKYYNAHPILIRVSLPTERSGKKMRVPVLVHFNCRISSEDAFAVMKSRGLDPADEREGLAFGEKYPEEQEKHPIPCLGKVIWILGYRYVLCLYGWLNKRRAELDLWRDGWGSGCHFLAFEQVQVSQF